MKKGLVLGLAVLMTFSLGGCGFNKEKVFTSKNGIHVNATVKWKEATQEELLKEMYNDMSEEDLQMVDMGLLTPSGMYFLIEKLDLKDYKVGMEEDIAFYTEAAKAFEEEGLTGDAILEAFKNLGSEAPEEDKAFMELVTSKDFVVNDYMLKMLGEDWKESLEQNYGNTYKFIGEEDTQLLGEKAQMREYTYRNPNAKEDVHAYELDVIKGDILYTFYASASEEDFQNQSEELKTMITTAYEGEIKEGGK